MIIRAGVSWRCVDAYAAGTSHTSSQTPCQDRCALDVFTSADGADILVCVVSDGAGSASRAEQGAEIVCEVLLKCVRSALATNSDLDEITDEFVTTWFRAIYERARSQASEDSADVRDYAATALLAIAAPFQTLCAQIGDGGIVLLPANDAEFRVAIWPEAAEYANETFFVTDGTSAEHVQIQRFDAVNDVIVFSDGLQRLALEQPTRTAHERFFSPLVGTVRSSEDVAALKRDLLAYLNSPAINERTDDDKSLAIACRL